MINRLPPLAAALILAASPEFASATLRIANVDAASLITVPDTAPAAAAGIPENPFRLAHAPPHRRVLLAHAILVKANPDKEASITDTPEEVLLVFNENVGQEYLALAVVDESGRRVDHHDAKLDFTDHSHLRASVDKLNPGRYMVRYRVLSADGHVVSGKYFFQVNPVKGDSTHEPKSKPQNAAIGP